MISKAEEVSVIIPTRGSGRGLGRSIASAVDQEGVRTRLIVVVDGEPVDARDQRVLAGLSDPHRVIRVSRLGIPGALRNLGVQMVRTRLVAFLDDDDQWIESKLHQQLTLLRDSGCALTGSNAMRVEGGRPLGLYFENMPKSLTFRDLLMTNWLITSSVIADADVLRSVGGFPTDERFRACDDYACWLKVAAVGGLITTPKPLVRYSTNAAGSVSSLDILSGAETRKLALTHFTETSLRWRIKLTRHERGLLRRFTTDSPQ